MFFISIYYIKINSGGNFLFIITNINDYESIDQIRNQKNTRIKEILCNVSKIDTLAKKGGQPFLSILADHLMILTLEEENDLNIEQLDFLSSFLHKSLYKSILPNDLNHYYNKSLLPEFKSINYLDNRLEMIKELINDNIFQKDKNILTVLNNELNEFKRNEDRRQFCSIF